MSYSLWSPKIKFYIYSLYLYRFRKKKITWKFILHLKVTFACWVFFHLSIKVKNLQLKSNLKNQSSEVEVIVLLSIQLKLKATQITLLDVLK